MIFGILRRFAILLFAVTAVFFALRVLPGDAITTQLIESGVGQQEVASRLELLGLDKPVLVQYLDYLIKSIQGQWGVSLSNGLPVFDIVLPALHRTIVISILSLIGASLLGFVLAYLSQFGKALLSYSAKTVLYMSISVPVFVSSIALLLIFDTASVGFLLPVLALSLNGSGTIGRVTYTVVNEQMQNEFVRTAYAKGLTRRSVVRNHVIPASMVPILAVISLQFSFLIGGTVIIESIFGINGIGQVILNSTVRRDYPVVQGAILAIAVLITLTNTCTELLYGVFDPRLRQ